MSFRLALPSYTLLLIAAILFNAGVSGKRRHGSKEIKTKQQMVCETNTIRIKCHKRDVIRIIDVFWGRKDDDFCGSKDLPYCLNGTSAFDIVDRRCHKRHRCLVDATVASLGNPCSEVTKNSNYLQIAHQCYPRRRRDDKHHKTKPKRKKKYKKCKPVKGDVKTAIPNAILAIECKKRDSIVIKSAKYGKFIKHCKKQGIEKVKNSGSKRKTFKEVYKTCHGRKRCNLPVKPARFGDNGSIGDKHLQVAYKCKKIPLQTLDVGVNHTGDVECYHHRKIFVHSVKKNCRDFVENECQGHRKCTVSKCRLKYSCQKKMHYKKNHHHHHRYSKLKIKHDATSKESKENGKNGDEEPSKENEWAGDDEPSKESKEKGKSDDEPSKESKEKGKSDDEPSKESKEKGKSDDEPSKESKEKGKSDDEPSKESKEKGKSDDEPSKESKENGKNGDDEPSKESKEKGKNDDEPSKESKEKGKNDEKKRKKEKKQER